MTAVTFPLRPPRLAFAICGWRWQNDLHEIKYKVIKKKKKRKRNSYQRYVLWGRVAKSWYGWLRCVFPDRKSIKEEGRESFGQLERLAFQVRQLGKRERIVDLRESCWLIQIRFISLFLVTGMAISLQTIIPVSSRQNLPNRFYYQENNGRWPWRVFRSHQPHYHHQRSTTISITINWYPRISCALLNLTWMRKTVVVIKSAVHRVGWEGQWWKMNTREKAVSD